MHLTSEYMHGQRREERPAAVSQQIKGASRHACVTYLIKIQMLLRVLLPIMLRFPRFDGHYYTEVVSHVGKGGFFFSDRALVADAAPTGPLMEK